MKDKIKAVELLAPAGSLASLKAGINAGADAVYMGGSRFGARAYAENPEEDEFLKAIDYVHLHGKQIYMTVNTLLKETEMKALYDYILPYYMQGLDAVIVQDLGVLAFLKREFPELPLHVSTQATISSVYGARSMKAMGAVRVVAPRELSLHEIKQIKNETGLEMEAFVHGALCYCYSGQCLLSSFLGGRSGNRGRCAQPCRLPYQLYEKDKKLSQKDENYLLSPKDLCTLDILPDLIAAGIDSLKIEGRMKSPRYTAGVVSIYRQYMDEYQANGKTNYKVAPKDRQMLLDLFDRGGFTKGYYFQQNGADMLALQEKPAFREGNEALFRELDEAYVKREKKEKIKGKVSILKELPAKMDLEFNGFKLSVTGSIPLKAQNQPLQKERLVKQLQKTGSTPFSFQELEIHLENGLFMTMQDINELRRTGLEALEQEFVKQYYRNQPVGLAEPNHELITTSTADFRKLHVLLEEEKLFASFVRLSGIDVIEIDSAGFRPERWADSVKSCHQEGKQCYLALPYIFRERAIRFFTNHMETLQQAGFDGFLVRSLDGLDFLKAQGFQDNLIGDYTLYSYNQESSRFYLEAGITAMTMPVELNKKDLQQRGGYPSGLLVYGHQPLMISAQCLIRTTKGCRKRAGISILKDRKGMTMAVRNQCLFCYNIIYNGVPSSLLNDKARVDGLNPAFYRLAFTTETEQKALAITQAFIASWQGQNQGLSNEEEKALLGEFTRGHFNRGIE